ncbi:MAG: tetratricopeptide repeat protein, partial [Spirochaetota bacterium]
RNYDVIYNINTNADYFDVSSKIYFNKSTVMKISDQFIRNLRRSVLSLVLFMDHEKDNVLFLDGNHKFHENNVYGVFDHAECVDYLDKKQVDYNNLPLAGRKSIMTFKTDIITFLRDRDREYECIVDIPNIYDQNFNTFRFSPVYYDRMKQYLDGKKIFVQIIQPSHANTCLANNAAHGFRTGFTHSVVFFFGESMVFFGSDEFDFGLHTERLSEFNTLIEGNMSYKSLFYKDIHALSYIMSTSLKQITQYTALNYLTMPFGNHCSSFYFTDDDYTDFLENHDRAFMLDLSSLSTDEREVLKMRIEEDDEILTFLKKAEHASMENDYQMEANFLSKLQEKADYNFDVRHYIRGLISVKELTFIKAAAEFEEGRDWNKAKEIYESILILNEDNFEAHYRLGLIYITLQKIEKAFEHFDRAMNLDPTNPKVLYQMAS